ncbi:hypothetical protein Smp_132030 [Schistosoma mansoni]|uniref:hypothetical protein n=1 Tax=Schistosoma mansoni TaxID=6183 RepID=UPI0001A639F1|nr:hypothetical protein Smp_132030 [Schistosoma mansoni]|eukprot:XP_018654862.1 hypothetical protein Smp_132030 [Schistosoma mansoni]
MESRSGSGATPAANSATHLSKTVSYICGECRAENEIRPRELVRCLECGHRVLYKKRSKRKMSFCAVIFLFFLKLTDLVYAKGDYVYFYLPVPFLSAA